MAEISTLARPYAEAVFRIADASGKLGEWSGTLSNLANVSVDSAISRAINDPNLPAPKVAGIFIHVLAGKLTAEAENLVRVLAENRRLELLPEIASQYEMLKNEREGIVEAQIVSAFPLADAQLAELVSGLEKRTGKRVRPQVSVDSELIAGVRVVIGDKVIDGSARAQLTALEAALKH
ncbi:MAG: F0F1 ATP synthase subunit delta [Betaproteobacteria bacterium]|nr:MAG: F0F1 ATP synthase subunit delta [Betaproteobacteria bacterium]